jgi:hypothetical protein
VLCRTACGRCVSRGSQNKRHVHPVRLAVLVGFAAGLAVGCVCERFCRRVQGDGSSCRCSGYDARHVLHVCTLPYIITVKAVPYTFGKVSLQLPVAQGMVVVVV